MVLVIKHSFIEGAGTLGEFFHNSDYKVKTVELEKGEPLPSLDGCEAVISLGGPMNVYETEKFPFLIAEDALIRAALKEEVPFLGICLGAQLLAKAAGADVMKAPQREIGWYDVQVTKEGKHDFLLRGMPNAFLVFQWHEDTFEIPQKGVLLATSLTCQNQVFRIGPCAWGIQFHCEMDFDMLLQWLEQDHSNIDKGELLLTYFKNREHYDHYSHILYLNFVRIITRLAKKKI